MKATAVIGANFGDEGKGAVTAHLVGAAPATSIVVRFNGGAQAGHTVVTPRRRHVFHHFGSGTLAGAASFLSRHFIVNPFLWEKERDELGHAELLVDPSAMLTTPFDMLLNQVAERKRGDGRHGSCGIGINETVTRCQSLMTSAGMTRDTDQLRDTLIRIRTDYLPARVVTLGLAGDTWLDEYAHSDRLLDSYLEACDRFARNVAWAEERDLRSFSHVIFEGAQGLLLDETHRYFPHVTRSRTGLTNVAGLCERIGLDTLDAVYVTRSYMTRHGRGPFLTEDPTMRFADATNIPNEWQGTLRFGTLDVDLLEESITNDLRSAATLNVNLRVSASIAMTCLDQHEFDLDRLPLPVRYIGRGEGRLAESEATAMAVAGTQ